MKHAGREALARLFPLLQELRARPALHERSHGVFSLRSRAFLHFHEDASGLYADVRLGEEFVRLPASSREEQARLLQEIDAHLARVPVRRGAGPTG
jgi:hypothetical protein